MLCRYFSVFPSWLHVVASACWRQGSKSGQSWKFQGRAWARAGGLALTVLGLGLLAACKPTETPPAVKAPPPVPVSVQRVALQSVPQWLEVMGQTEGMQEVAVRPRVSGLLLRRLYTEGSWVHKDQALFALDPQPFELARNRVRGLVAEQQVRLTQAEREYQRLNRLLASQAVSEKEVDDARSLWQLQQSVAQTLGEQLREAELNLSYTVVRSPASGVAGRMLVPEGSVLAPGGNEVLTTVVQSHPMRVRFGLSETELARFSQGASGRALPQAVTLVWADGSTYPLPGRLDFTAPTLNPEVGTLTMRAVFANPNQALLAGQFVRVRLPLGSQPAVALPATAVQLSEQGASVFVINAQGQAELRPVQTLPMPGVLADAKQTWVRAGLRSGEQVILDNLMKLKPGAAVTVQPVHPAAAAGR